MNAQEFAYWLQGFVELHGEMPTPEQWQSIKDHLALVFVKVTQPVKKETAYPNELTKVPRLSDFQWPGGVQPVITCSAGDAGKSLADCIGRWHDPDKLNFSIPPHIPRAQ